MAEGGLVINYIASPTLERFHMAPEFIRVVRGPAGSGKSVGCVMETIRLASLQRPQRDRPRGGELHGAASGSRARASSAAATRRSATGSSRMMRPSRMTISRRQ